MVPPARERAERGLEAGGGGVDRVGVGDIGRDREGLNAVGAQLGFSGAQPVFVACDHADRPAAFGQEPRRRTTNTDRAARHHPPRHDPPPT